MADVHLSKTCTLCKEEKPLTDFYPAKNRKDGREHRCIVCSRERVKHNYIPDPEKENFPKQCTLCKKIKTQKDFYKSKNNKSGLKSTCIECESERCKNINNIFNVETHGENILCTKCKSLKHHSEFNKSKTSKSGLYRWCKSCQKESGKLKHYEPVYDGKLKLCTKCGVEKDKGEFREEKRVIGGLYSWCRSCSNEALRLKNNYPDNKSNDKLKQCCRCNTDKPLSEFGNNKRGSDGKQAACKQCVSDSSSHRNNTPEVNYKNERKTCSKCGVEKLGKDFYLNKNILGGLNSSCKLCDREYARNKGAGNAKNARRRAAKLKAIPKWCDKQKVEAIYEECARITKETGIIHHVDHIVPLQSSYVCGLHCESNLKIITSSENQRKLNTHWPDMPDRLDRSVAATERNLAKLTKS
jgi:hypothetical protein